jgi:hypothetical protein
MESKKINQLATELAPVLSDLTIIGDPTTGISKKITLSQMASLFTGTVEEYPNLASFPLVGTADTIYIALDTNIIYRWNTGTSAYVELSPNIVTSLVFSDANGFDGTISLVGSTATLTITTALTTGSVPFIGDSGALSQDNANLFFDDTNNRLGINTNSPTTALDVFGSGIIGRINGTSTNNAFLGFASAGTNKWSIGNVQSDHRFRIYSETNTSELVSVLQTGEFGIGIANPTTKLHIDGGASALIANLDANISVAKSISFRSDNSARINLEVSGTESGSNVGADLFIRTYTDAGALLATPLTITRSTSAATFSSSVTANGIISTSDIRSNSGASDGQVVLSKMGGSNYGGGTYFAGDNGTNQSGFRIGMKYASSTSALAIDYSTNTQSYGASPTALSYSEAFRIALSNGAATFSNSLSINTSIAGVASTITNVNDSSEGLLVRTSDNDGSLYILRLQSSVGATSQTWVDRLTVAKSGITNFYSDVQLPVGNYVQWLAYSDANSRTWAFRNNETEVGDFAISSSVNNSNTLSAVRFRINRSGQIGINQPTFAGSEQVSIKAPSGDYGMRIYAPNTTNNCYGLWVDAGSSSADNALFIRNQAGSTTYFQVRGDGNTRMNSAVFSNTTSGTTRGVYIGNGDYFLGGVSSIRQSKKNIQEFTSEWIYDLKPVQFNYRKKDEEGNYTEEIYEEVNYGLIAEDTAPIADFLINYDDTKDGEKIMVGIEYSRLITPMLKEIQELKKEIELLKAK